MSDVSKPFFAVAANPDVAALIADPRPALVFDRSGTRILWANAAGHDLVGARTTADLIRRALPAAGATARRIAALAPLLGSAPKTERVPLPVGIVPVQAVCRVSRVIVDATRTVLLLVADGTGAAKRPDLAAARYDALVADLRAAEQAVAAPAASAVAPVDSGPTDERADAAAPAVAADVAPKAALEPPQVGAAAPAVEPAGAPEAGSDRDAVATSDDDSEDRAEVAVADQPDAVADAGTDPVTGPASEDVAAESLDFALVDAVAGVSDAAVEPDVAPASETAAADSMDFALVDAVVGVSDAAVEPDAAPASETAAAESLDFALVDSVVGVSDAAVEPDKAPASETVTESEAEATDEATDEAADAPATDPASGEAVATVPFASTSGALPEAVEAAGSAPVEDGSPEIDDVAVTEPLPALAAPPLAEPVNGAESAAPDVAALDTTVAPEAVSVAEPDVGTLDATAEPSPTEPEAVSVAEPDVAALDTMAGLSPTEQEAVSVAEPEVATLDATAEPLLTEREAVSVAAPDAAPEVDVAPEPAPTAEAAVAEADTDTDAAPETADPPEPALTAEAAVAEAVAETPEPSPSAGTLDAPAVGTETPEAADPGTPAPAVDAPPAGFVFPAHGRTVRFLFELDPALAFTFTSPDLADLVGPAAIPAAGEGWSALAARLGLDPLARVAAALSRKDTFTGLTVDWPVDGAALRVPVDLAGMPVFGRDRAFRGYRGFGMAKSGAAFAVATPLAAVRVPADEAVDLPVAVAPALAEVSLPASEAADTAVAAAPAHAEASPPAPDADGPSSAVAAPSVEEAPPAAEAPALVADAVSDLAGGEPIAAALSDEEIIEAGLGSAWAAVEPAEAPPPSGDDDQPSVADASADAPGPADADPDLVALTALDGASAALVHDVAPDDELEALIALDGFPDALEAQAARLATGEDVEGAAEGAPARVDDVPASADVLEEDAGAAPALATAALAAGVLLPAVVHAAEADAPSGQAPGDDETATPAAADVGADADPASEGATSEPEATAEAEAGAADETGTDARAAADDALGETTAVEAGDDRTEAVGRVDAAGEADTVRLAPDVGPVAIVEDAVPVASLDAAAEGESEIAPEVSESVDADFPAAASGIDDGVASHDDSLPAAEAEAPSPVLVAEATTPSDDLVLTTDLAGTAASIDERVEDAPSTAIDAAAGMAEPPVDGEAAPLARDGLSDAPEAAAIIPAVAAVATADVLSAEAGPAVDEARLSSDLPAADDGADAGAAPASTERASDATAPEPDAVVGGGPEDGPDRLAGEPEDGLNNLAGDVSTDTVATIEAAEPAHGVVVSAEAVQGGIDGTGERAVALSSAPQTDPSFGEATALSEVVPTAGEVSVDIVASDAAGAAAAVVAGDAARERDAAVTGDAAGEREAPVAGNAVGEREAAVAGDAARERDAAVTGDAAGERETPVAGDAAVEREAAVAGDTAGELNAALTGQVAGEHEAAVAGEAAEVLVAPAGDAATAAEPAVSAEDPTVSGDTSQVIDVPPTDIAAADDASTAEPSTADPTTSEVAAVDDGVPEDEATAEDDGVPVADATAEVVADAVPASPAQPLVEARRPSHTPPPFDQDVTWTLPSGDVIPSPIVPRPTPPLTPAEAEARRNSLSRPEREAFQKIAEALGARLEAGTLIDGDDDLAEAPAPVAPTVPLPPREALDASILDKLPVPVAILRDGEAMLVNRAFLDLADYPDQEALAAAGGFAAAFEGSPMPRPAAQPAIRRRDGVEVPVSVRLHSIPWGNTVASLLVLQETATATGRDRAATAEARVEELEAILDTATDGVLVLDAAGIVVGANRSAEALFGGERASMIGGALVDLLAPESHRSALDYLDGLARNGVASVLNDGREVIGRVRGGGLVPLFMTIGRVSSTVFCVVLRDITQWKRAEEELTGAKRTAEYASRQKSDFLAKISHEIRTPLNAIIGFSEVMMEERFGPVGTQRYKEYLHDIHVSGSHIMSLVNDLLDLSKIEAGKLDLAFEAVPVNEVIRECVALMQPQANRERIIIRTSLSSSLPSVVADNRSLRQIVLNLVSNAVKFNAPGGQVIVSTLYEPTGEVAIRVRDTGPGMSEDDIRKALEPFRQLQTARPGRGTGLGLPLTKALVEANRASFRIDSTIGQGTLAQVTFPSTRVLAE